MTVNVNGRRRCLYHIAGGAKREKTKKRGAEPSVGKRERKERGKEAVERVDRNDEAQLYEYYFPADVLDDRTSSPSSSS